MSNIKKFNFIVDHVDGQGNITKILERNFGVPFTYKPRIEWIDGSGFPTKKEEGVFENSYDAVNLSEELFKLLRMVLKDASMDYSERFSTTANPPSQEKDMKAKYRARIVDLQYPKRDNYGKVLQSVEIHYKDGEVHTTDTTEVNVEKIKVKNNVEKVQVEDVTVEKPIFDFYFNASDFVNFNPNFIPHFWKIWKDYSIYNSDTPNAEYSEDGLTKLTMYSGLRTIIKDYLTTDYRSLKNRFNQIDMYEGVNHYYMNNK